MKKLKICLLQIRHTYSPYEKMIAYIILRWGKRLISRYSIAVPFLKKWASVTSIYSVIIDVLKKKTNDKLGVIQAITRIFVAPIGN